MAESPVSYSGAAEGPLDAEELRKIDAYRNDFCGPFEIVASSEFSRVFTVYSTNHRRRAAGAPLKPPYHPLFE